MKTMNIDQQIERVFQCLYIAQDMDYIGEPVSQLEHALQCAYFAEQAGHSQEVILACLFHDIGHFASDTLQNSMANLGVVHHEWIGAKLAYSLGFSAKIALLIGNHVKAKRYLAGKKKDYFDRLSEASKQTLSFQGGVMTDEEMFQFEKNPHFKDILRVRVNDEKAKKMGIDVPNLSYYRPYLYNHFEKTGRTTENTLLPNYVDKEWIEQFQSFLES
ncbi:HD domain protein [Legionella gratiana]|uniref:HD domain protein n=1 Tax=Legionella gratiana TaxID=45066 RepID=A0A378JCX8_9GAMM|nr:HD domain-containing protein [Legionella gratiana]KTD06378.1 HD domain protein [Legionella gratiana]STX45196.1 Predicted HD phosphohydrolase [Legionella gratiana]